MQFDHHAFLIPHSYHMIRDALHGYVAPGEQSPEIIEMVEGTFPIDRVRHLIDLSLRKSEDRGQVFFIAFDSILHEAQNALLKVLEEPVPRTHFFLITSNPHKLLPTVLSRLAPSPFQFETVEHPQAASFLASSPSERLTFIKSIIESKDRRAASELLREMIIVLENRRASFSDLVMWGTVMRQMHSLQSYSEDPASSVKMLLEHAALTLPVIEDSKVV